MINLKKYWTHIFLSFCVLHIHYSFWHHKSSKKRLHYIEKGIKEIKGDLKVIKNYLIHSTVIDERLIFNTKEELRERNR